MTGCLQVPDDVRQAALHKILGKLGPVDKRKSRTEHFRKEKKLMFANDHC